jgi:hypothetical protein
MVDNELGPVDFMVVAFPGNKFKGEIAPALARLVEAGTVRIIDVAFVGKGGTGPIAAVEPEDLPEILLHVEGRAVALGIERIEFQVPGPNEVAARHLLARGFRIDPWINILMSNREFGRFDRVLPFGPPLFL